MKLLEVTLSGFKSFAHKTTFRFHNGLTVIIGPNGSGKSCLADSIRWVLGEQSLKSLRGKKSEDIIFAGSNSRPRAGAATVTLTLSNESGRLPIEASEVALARRIDRSGESEYTINGEPVRLLDIQQLLAEAGIGAKSYTVISQGTVDRYLQASPIARRELFDEATGIKPLQLKLQQAERKLLQVNRDAHELQTIQQELVPRLRVLKRQIARHEERQHLTQEYAAQAALWLHHAWHAAHEEVQHAQEAVAQADAAAKQATHERARVEQELLHTIEAATSNPRVELQRHLIQAEQALQTQQVAYTKFQEEKVQLISSLKHVRNERARAEARLAAVRQQTSQYDMVQTLRELLATCRQIFEDVLQDKQPAPDKLRQLVERIAAAMRQKHDEQNLLQAAEAIVEHVAGPLQAVARLQAIEQERDERLRALPDLPAPTNETVLALRAQLAAVPVDVTSDRSALRASLAHVRDREIAAQRASSAAQTAYDQAGAKVQDVERTIARERGSDFLHQVQTTPAPHTAHVSTEEELQRLAARVSVLGEIDPLALKEYEEVAARAARLTDQLQDITTTTARLQTVRRSLATTMQTQFREQFAVINRAFGQYFVQLFDGGDAQLILVDTVVEGAPGEVDAGKSVMGIEIMVHPPGKKTQHAGLLSGGEKALTSLALLLAILEVQQPPFLVLDEVDAALDEANSYRFATLLREKSVTTQCLVISHNRETMAQADVLYGITMQDDGVSRAYSVNLADIATKPNEEMRV